MTLSVEREFDDGAWRTVVRDVGAGSWTRLGPYRVAFDTPDISTSRVPLGPELPNGSIVPVAFAVPGPSNDGVWDGQVGNITLTIGIEDEEDWDMLVAYTVNNGAYATMPTEYQRGTTTFPGQSENMSPFTRFVGIVRVGTGHLWVRVGDQNSDPPTIGEADIYALVYSP